MRKIQVRVPVVVDHTGNWNAAGFPNKEGGFRPDDIAFGDLLDFIEPGERRYVLVAELEVPEYSAVPVEVEVSVESQGDTDG